MKSYLGADILCVGAGDELSEEAVQLCPFNVAVP